MKNKPEVLDVASIQICDIQGELHYYAFDSEEQLLGTAPVSYNETADDLDLSRFDFDGSAWVWVWDKNPYVDMAEQIKEEYYHPLTKVVADITETGVKLY